MYSPPHSNPLIGGFDIVASIHWPRRRIVEERHYPYHPIVTWIYTQLNRLGANLPMTIVAEYERWEDDPPLFDQSRGVIYCSPRQKQEILRRLKAAQ